jgi:hypothetical protein
VVTVHGIGVEAYLTTIGWHAEIAHGLASGPAGPLAAEVSLPTVLDGSAGPRAGFLVDYTGGLLPRGWTGGESFELGTRPPDGWVGNKVSGMQWISTPALEGVLALAVEGVGPNWYGEPDEGPDAIASPCGDAKGFHAAGYRLSAWISGPTTFYRCTGANVIFGP